MKILILSILITCTACTPSYNNRPIQDQVVGGTSLLDAITSRERVGMIAKQAHYDIFISKSVPSTKWFVDYPILNLFARPDGYEICSAPPADAMSSTASSLAAAISVEGSTAAPGSPEVKLAGSLADGFANKMKAFSIRTQGLQYMRDVRFDNCMIWQNRGNLDPTEKKMLRDNLIQSNKNAGEIGKELILRELMLRAATNNFGVSSVSMTKEEIIEIETRMDSNIEKMDGRMEKLAQLMKKFMIENKKKDTVPKN